MDQIAALLSRIGNTGHAYPRPLLVREDWTCLNGRWDFAFDRNAKWTRPSEVTWTHEIVVPFAPETAASGIRETDFFAACWYRRTIPSVVHDQGQRVILHFGAVDYRAAVWLNDELAVSHEGGYTPFSVDVTAHLSGAQPITVVVRAEDDPADLTKPRGKQDWKLAPHAIWYPRTTGIWQSVWLERVPQTHIAAVQWSGNLERWEIALNARVSGPPQSGLRLHVTLRVGDAVLATDSYSVSSGEVHRRVALSDPGIDDFRNELLWSPGSPTLIGAELVLADAAGRTIDRAFSYTALRSMTVEGDRFLLNGRVYPLRLVLDQGYWPESGMTAPGDEAFKRDVELARQMGFNGVRKHQKIEDPRYLYWADRLGLLVWEEMPSAYRYTTESIARLTQQWTAAILRDCSHPCIAAWVPFNESWGVPNLPDNPNERHFVLALYHLTKSLDSSRPVIGNDGWESVATDIIGIHDYGQHPESLARRYRIDSLPRLFRHERPGGRKLIVGPEPQIEHPVVLSEFGGIMLSRAADAWGYGRASSAETLAAKYAALLATVRSLDLICGFCYTQFADTFQEANGLLYADRTPKCPLDVIARATTGVES